MYETDFNWEGFKIQLGQFSTMVDSNEVSIGKVDTRSAQLSKTTFGYAYNQRYQVIETVA